MTRNWCNGVGRLSAPSLTCTCPPDRHAIRDAIYTITAKIAKPVEHANTSRGLCPVVCHEDWMTALGIGPDARRRLSAPRIAEIVADELRRQIIDGELADGDLLPRQEVLVEQFNVSLVSLREALRILETEGLVSVRRGNRGGAVVHAPAKASAAYMLGLLLQSDYVPLADLGTALQELEPMCAALAARRPDRGDERVDGRAHRRRGALHRDRRPISR